MNSSRDRLDKAFDAFINYEIRTLNNHLPKKRRALNELLQSVNPTVEAVDGSLILLKSVDLKELSKIVPVAYHDRVHLPIVMMRRMDLGKSVFTVAGDRYEELTVEKVLGQTTDGFHEAYKHEKQSHFYRPEVNELVMRFPSLIVIGFGISRELASQRRD